MEHTKEHRSWVATINNPTPQDEEQWLELTKGAKYSIVGHEVGENGTPHMQCYIVFKRSQNHRWVSKRLSRAHLEAAKGNGEQNRAYCSKEGKYEETGQRPVTHKEAGKRSADSRAKWKDILDLSRTGNNEELEEKHPHVAFMFGKRIDDLRKEELKRSVKARHEGELQNEWYYGAPGTGKSVTARDKYPDAYIKAPNKWWDGYANEKTVLLEDFDRRHERMAPKLKIWADRYITRVETKGDHMMINPERIVVTSNYTIDEIFPVEQDAAPVHRRFKQVLFTGLGQAEYSERHAKGTLGGTSTEARTAPVRYASVHPMYPKDDQPTIDATVHSEEFVRALESAKNKD